MEEEAFISTLNNSYCLTYVGQLEENIQGGKISPMRSKGIKWKVIFHSPL